MDRIAPHSADEIIEGKRHHQHISNCSRFNSISPQFHRSPGEGGARSASALAHFLGLARQSGGVMLI